MKNILIQKFKLNIKFYFKIQLYKKKLIFFQIILQFLIKIQYLINISLYKIMATQKLLNYYPKATVLKQIPFSPFNKNQKIYIKDQDNLYKTLIQIYKTHPQQRLDVVSDFDHTITDFYYNNQPVSPSFGILNRSQHVTIEMENQAKEIFEIYSKYENTKQYTFEFKYQKMEEWVKLTAELFVKFQINSVILQNILNDNTLCFRYGFNDFLKYCVQQNINFIVISGGIQDVIYYMMNQITELNQFQNLMIISNKMLFDNDGNIVGFSDKRVHSHNKYNLLKHQDYPQLKKNCILLGDLLHDIYMTKNSSYENQIRFGFAKKDDEVQNFLKKYDIVLLNQGSYIPVECILRSLISNDNLPLDILAKLQIISPELVEVLFEFQSQKQKLQN
ncbi:hypothetical protein IMG5_000680 [Ichthyophthirius multifiliis]|uniref:5'-nucleotidase n=1 Tax=Ichthyophthirius multifiliis TaxID=5932 RepID=G0QIV5_ICHMU|nr:hypothetical protein IMG5_000680 [Ichthyophthirius multifiliis]EGR34840.1 hypothetical protein IMG5_000680 [Ichthyophthirius multifiliis]|eukprot:XP_004040144.1 hypothetical protein IMG5_000680 [Ichthyophthirius multifiliis]